MKAAAANGERKFQPIPNKANSEMANGE